jgi:murein DD-endopeptidase MepM/ murein hydrolase activator NlpD
VRVIAIALLWLAPAFAAAQDDAGTPSTPPPPAPVVVDGVTIPPEIGPIHWAESHGRQCHRSRGHRMCEGPRRVPIAEGAPAARAEALGITSGLARRVLTERPRDAWITEAGPAPTDLLWPVQGGRLWRTFGLHQGIVVRRGRLSHTRRRHPHEGIDIGAPRGTPILAANDGLVVYSDNGMTGYGNGVLIVHGDGSVTLYGHCAATFVVAGQQVRRGQVIAAVGDTGLAHGAHLHFELHVDGQAVDPLPRIAARPDVPAPSSDGAPAPPDPPAEPRSPPDEELDEP